MSELDAPTLQQFGAWLAQWAAFIQSQGAASDGPSAHWRALVAADDGPPAHWLEMIEAQGGSYTPAEQSSSAYGDAASPSWLLDGQPMEHLSPDAWQHTFLAGYQQFAQILFGDSAAMAELNSDVMSASSALLQSSTSSPTSHHQFAAASGDPTFQQVAPAHSVTTPRAQRIEVAPPAGYPTPTPQHPKPAPVQQPPVHRSEQPVAPPLAAAPIAPPISSITQPAQNAVVIQRQPMHKSEGSGSVMSSTTAALPSSELPAVAETALHPTAQNLAAPQQREHRSSISTMAIEQPSQSLAAPDSDKQSAGLPTTPIPFQPAPDRMPAAAPHVEPVQAVQMQTVESAVDASVTSAPIQASQAQPAPKTPRALSPALPEQPYSPPAALAESNTAPFIQKGVGEPTEKRPAHARQRLNVSLPLRTKAAVVQRNAANTGVQQALQGNMPPPVAIPIPVPLSADQKPSLPARSATAPWAQPQKVATDQTVPIATSPSQQLPIAPLSRSPVAPIVAQQGTVAAPNVDPTHSERRLAAKQEEQVTQRRYRPVAVPSQTYTSSQSQTAAVPIIRRSALPGESVPQPLAHMISIPDRNNATAAPAPQFQSANSAKVTPPAGPVQQATPPMPPPATPQPATTPPPAPTPSFIPAQSTTPVPAQAENKSAQAENKSAQAENKSAPPATKPREPYKRPYDWPATPKRSERTSRDLLESSTQARRQRLNNEQRGRRWRK